MTHTFNRERHIIKKNMDIKKIIREEIENSWDWTNQDLGPLSWLINNFCDLTELSLNGYDYYRNSELKTIFVHPQNENENSYVYVNYLEVWLILEKDYGLDEVGIQNVVSEWLSTVYGLTGLLPRRIVV